MKVVIKRKLKPLSVIDGQDHLTEGVRHLPPGTLVKGVIYYGPRGPRQADFSIDQGETWFTATFWSNLPLSEGTKVRYV